MNLLTEHPQSVDETYWQHCRRACSYGASLTVNGLACLIHAFIPPLFRTNASDCVLKLSDEMRNRRQKPESKPENIQQ